MSVQLKAIHTYLATQCNFYTQLTQLNATYTTCGANATIMASPSEPPSPLHTMMNRSNDIVDDCDDCGENGGDFDY